MGLIGDYFLILLSSFKEDKRLKKGKEMNDNLPSAKLAEIERLEKKAANGASETYYNLGLMFLQDSSVGYDPERAISYFDKGRRMNNFNCAYAGALYYKGHWSYQHVNDYNSYMWYLDATNCSTQNSEFMTEAHRAIKNDFKVTSTEKDGIKITMIKDVKIV